MAPSNHVLFDCDGGSDDAWALMLLIKAEALRHLRILGITICGSGNTSLHNAAYNMLRLLKTCGRDEIPIFLGASSSLLSSEDHENRRSFHGKDGFGDILPPDDDIDVVDMAEGEHAVSSIYQFCVENPREVTLIVMGPLTNVALCHATYGERFSVSVRDMYVMGGNYQGVGNCTRSAEFNFYSDPEAAHIVLSKSRYPITLLPWESCMQDRFPLCMTWRLQQFASRSNLNPTFNLLNVVETAQYLQSSNKVWNPCDAILVAAYLFSSQFILKKSYWHCMVELNGNTRGQMVLDHLHEVEKHPKNVCLIELVDAEFFKKVAEWSMGLRELSVDLPGDLIVKNVFKDEYLIDADFTE